MNVEIIVAIIAASGGLLGSLIGVISATKLTTFRISQLEDKVDKHNNFIKRIYEVEKVQTLQEEKLKVANHRIDDLEKIAT